MGSIGENVSGIEGLQMEENDREEKILVLVRLRPLNEKENSSNEASDWECINDTTILYRNTLREGSTYPSAYSFDRVFRGDCSTRQVYDDGVKEVALSVVRGINSCVFAYGQTSSGKTYTMMGITEHTVSDIFEYMEKHGERAFVLKFSAIEIYNEAIRDLLSADAAGLRLLDDQEKGTVVEKITEEPLRDWSHLQELLSICEAQRKIGETSLNEKSSRSHQILKLTIESASREFLNKESSATLSASVNFVDLAGSERASQASSTGTRLKEGCHINRSLLTLGTVIRKLSKGGRQGHINYRDSKLTRLLQPALGGNSKTAIICTMSPARTHVEQTRNTLLFACCAKEVSTKSQVNVVMSDKALVKHLQKEVARLENELRSPSMPSSDGDILKMKDAQIKKMEKEIAELTLQRDLADARVQDLLRIIGHEKDDNVSIADSYLSTGNTPLHRNSYAITCENNSLQRDSYRSNGKYNSLQRDSYRSNGENSSLQRDSYRSNGEINTPQRDSHLSNRENNHLRRESYRSNGENSSLQRYSYRSNREDSSPQRDSHLSNCENKLQRESYLSTRDSALDRDSYIRSGENTPLNFACRHQTAEEEADGYCKEVVVDKQCESTLHWNNEERLALTKVENSENGLEDHENELERGSPESSNRRKWIIVNSSENGRMARSFSRSSLGSVRPDEEIPTVEAFVAELKDMANQEYEAHKLAGENTNFEIQMKRNEIIMLWQEFHVSLIHRTYFLMLFKGDPSDSIYIEVEHKRLVFLKENVSVWSAKKLNGERLMLCKLMKKRLTEEERKSIYGEWGIDVNSKQRRQQLAAKLWSNVEDMDHVTKSAAIVAKLVRFMEQGENLHGMFGLSFSPAAPSSRRKSLAWSFSRSSLA